MVLSEKPRQLKIDNWGIFVLQKLESFYTRGDLCDLTLRFNDGKEIAVHKALLMGCTDYFKCLPTSSSGKVLQMPDSLRHEFVLPIINFMYSGKLEYKPEVHAALYNTARVLNMTVLAKLFDAQVKSTTPPPPVVRSYVRKPATLTSSASNSETASTSTSTALPGKKLPIWKKRSAPGYLPEEFYQSEAMQVYKQTNNEPEEVARPTRFEWPDESEEPPVLYNPTFDTLSYTTKPMVKPPADLKCDEPASSKPSVSVSEIPKMMPTKRMLPSTIIGDVKRSRMSERVYSAPENEEDDDDDDDGHFETLHDIDYDEDDDEDETEEFVPVSVDSSRVNNTIRTAVSMSATTVTTLSKSSSVITPVKSSAPETVQKTAPQVPLKPSQTPHVTPTVQTPKPILKVLSSEQSTHPTKKVRFSLSEGKENSKDKEVVPATPAKVQAQTVTIPITTSPNSPTGSTQNVNHAKIIAEVLKKYPDLVKNNKNIKLKILGPGKTPGGNKLNALSSTSASKKPVSYVVMKSDATGTKQLPGKSNHTQSGAENTNGPWLCHKCGDNDEPVQFDTYYLYRKHLQDVHMERIDARICEYCGLRSSKRNLHLYHMYTKHNIAPPRNINFPKCDQCDYIALSESLLIKHRNNHSTTSKDYICRICSAAFKSNGALQGHMTTNLHDHGKKNYQCKYCKKIFNRNINLKAHIRTAHQEECRRLYEDEEKQDEIQEQPDQSVLQIIELPVINSVSTSDKDQQHTLILPSGMTILAESPSVPLMPSSESEAMTNVASGIATSINLTNANVVNSEQNVILLDENSDFICFKEHIVLNNDGSCQEYIVPEIIESDSGQMYATGIVNYTISSGNVNYTSSSENITDGCSVSGYNNGEIIHTQESGNITSGSDHTYAEDSGQTVRHEDKSDSNDQSMSSNEHVIPDLEITETKLQNLQSDSIVDQEETHDYTQISNELIVDSESGNLIMNANWIQIDSDKQMSKTLPESAIPDDTSFTNENNVIDNGQESVEARNMQNNADANLQQNSTNCMQNNINLEMVNNISKEWDFDDDDNADDADDGDEDTDLKPTRPTIDLVPTPIPTDI